MPMKSDREYRSMEMAALESDEMRVEGYASTFDQPYELYRDGSIVVREVVEKSAFDDADLSDVIMQYNHEGRVFARVSNGTLEVTPKDEGLFISANLGGTELGRGLYEEIRGGYTDKMSFGFIVDDDEWDSSEEDGVTIETRRITKVRKVFDVSAVSLPANPQTAIEATEASIRNLTDGVISRILAERQEKEAMELRRRRLAVKAKAIGGNND